YASACHARLREQACRGMQLCQTLRCCSPCFALLLSHALGGPTCMVVLTAPGFTAARKDLQAYEYIWLAGLRARGHSAGSGACAAHPLTCVRLSVARQADGGWSVDRRPSGQSA